ncbi:hypothetical protein LINPERHAP1_LOCUS6430 [Linum perenne]
MVQFFSPKAKQRQVVFFRTGWVGRSRCVQQILVYVPLCERGLEPLILASRLLGIWVREKFIFSWTRRPLFFLLAVSWRRIPATAKQLGASRLF